MGRDNSVGIATGYGLDDRMSGVRFPAELWIFLFETMFRPALRPTQPPIQWVPGVLSLGVKRQRREADHSPPSSAEVKECVELYLHPLIGFMVWYLVKHRGNFTFYLNLTNLNWNIIHYEFITNRTYHTLGVSSEGYGPEKLSTCICSENWFLIYFNYTSSTIGVLGFDTRRGLGIFLFTTASRMVLEPTQPPIWGVPGALSLGVKRPGREADHSPPSSAEVEEWVELYVHSLNTPSWRGA
jgi:hypothetical protein